MFENKGLFSNYGRDGPGCYSALLVSVCLS